MLAHRGGDRRSRREIALEAHSTGRQPAHKRACSMQVKQVGQQRID